MRAQSVAMDAEQAAQAQVRHRRLLVLQCSIGGSVLPAKSLCCPSRLLGPLETCRRFAAAGNVLLVAPESHEALAAVALKIVGQGRPGLHASFSASNAFRGASPGFCAPVHRTSGQCVTQLRTATRKDEAVFHVRTLARSALASREVFAEDAWLHEAVFHVPWF